MKIKNIGIIPCLILTLPMQALNHNPYANGYGKAETKEEFLQLLRQDIEHAKERAAAGDPDAYRYVAKRLEANYKHNWFEKNPVKGFICIFASTVLLLALLPRR